MCANQLITGRVWLSGEWGVGSGDWGVASASADSFTRCTLEEVRFLQIECKRNLRPERWQLQRRDAGSYIVPARARVDESLVPKRFDEIKFRGSSGEAGLRSGYD